MTHEYIGTKIVTAWPEVSDNGDGYAVKYADGYTSWSPKETFEEAYRVIHGSDQNLTFGDALILLKAGRRIARRGWNAKNLFVYLVPPACYPAQTGAAKKFFGENSLVPYSGYMAIKSADNIVDTWVPSVRDCLAHDWMVLD